MKITFVTVADLPEGWGRTGRLRTLVGALTGLGHDVHIWNEHSLEGAGPQLVSGSMCGGSYEYVLGTIARGRGLAAARVKGRAVREILRRMRHAARHRLPDVLIFNNLSFYDTFPITRLARTRGIPTIQCYEDERLEVVERRGVPLSQRLFGLNSWAADRWCSPMAHQLWVISSYLHEKYSRLCGDAKRVHVVPTIVDCNEWQIAAEPDRERAVILYSGGFGPHEDIDKLIDALAVLKQWGIAFEARLVGASATIPRVAFLKNQVRRLGIEDDVTFVGFSPAAVVRAELENANLLMNLRTDSLWSRSGLSTKLSEYLAAGRTVVTTDVGDNARYVEHGTSALVVSTSDSPEHVASIMRAALSNASLRRRLGEGARQAALSHFDTRVVQRRLGGLLEMAVSRRAVA